MTRGPPSMSPADWWTAGPEHWTGVSADDIVGLHRGGHEIACHTFSHAAPPTSTRPRWPRRSRKTAVICMALDPSIKIENFAYPYGLGRCRASASSAETFRSSRGILPGVNSGTVDLQYLRAMPLIDRHIDPRRNRSRLRRGRPHQWLADLLQPRRGGRAEPLWLFAIAAAPCAGGGASRRERRRSLTVAGGDCDIGPVALDCTSIPRDRNAHIGWWPDICRDAIAWPRRSRIIRWSAVQTIEILHLMSDFPATASASSEAAPTPPARRAFGAEFRVRPARLSRRAGGDRPPCRRRRQLPGADADRRRQVAVLSIAVVVARGLRHRGLAADRADARPGRGAARGRRQGGGAEFDAVVRRSLRGRARGCSPAISICSMSRRNGC